MHFFSQGVKICTTHSKMHHTKSSIKIKNMKENILEKPRDTQNHEASPVTSAEKLSTLWANIQFNTHRATMQLTVMRNSVLKTIIEIYHNLKKQIWKYNVNILMMMMFRLMNSSSRNNLAYFLSSLGETTEDQKNCLRTTTSLFDSASRFTLHT